MNDDVGDSYGRRSPDTDLYRDYGMYRVHSDGDVDYYNNIGRSYGRVYIFRSPSTGNDSSAYLVDTDGDVWYYNGVYYSYGISLSGD